MPAIEAAERFIDVAATPKAASGQGQATESRPRSVRILLPNLARYLLTGSGLRTRLFHHRRSIQRV